MSKTKPTPPNTPAGYRKEITSTLRKLSGRHDVHRIFSDWMEMSAIALAKLDLNQAEAREARYMQIVKQYSREELDQFCKMLAWLVLLLEAEPRDQMTKIFEELELGNKHTGQFFTPWEVSFFMAKMTVAGGSLKKQADDEGFITMMEPCCGAGGIILAFALACKDEAIDYQRQIHVTAVDIDARCVHMSFVQCALMGIPAIIHRGDTLANAFSETWYTPMHIMNGWSRKLHARHIDERDNGWWRAYTAAQKIDFCVEHGIDLETALQDKAPDGAKPQSETAELETA